MASPRSNNYLRSNRKRLGFTQAEIAFLLGTRGGTKVCRYERFARDPNLETALAYEIVLGKPARELFASLYKKIQKQVAERAKVLTYRTDFQSPKGKNVEKLQVLKRIVACE